MKDLHKLGWNPFFAKAFEPFDTGEYLPARVAVQHKGHYFVYSELGELQGKITGRLRHRAAGTKDFPAVGDWVVIRARPEEAAATITDILPRRTKFSRKVAGAITEEQILAANIDIAFIVSGLDEDFNPRRIERYLVLTTESGAEPVVVLNKADLCDDLPEVLNEVSTLSGGAPVLVTSVKRNEGLDQLAAMIGEGQTGTLLGSSGVGKSSIVNHLLGAEHFVTREVRETDSRGRHATTHRELVLLPGGGMLIDTPGMRELQLWGETSAVAESFDDVEELIATCKFTDCRHDTEPGCAVRRALEEGTLDPERFASYQKLQKEMDYLTRKQDLREQLKEKERWKKLTARHKRNYKKPR
ncbi:ribosome small subunit-dependent GTPase A [bacterium]|nr:MAG: ribosome small subunit-dependent GTPase A [bacterium]